MGRQWRPYLPGGFFHLFARTQARVHWFDSLEVKDAIVRILADAAEESDVVLNAFVVMNNHFHLIVQQRDAPLATFMQPLVRRTALVVQQKCGIENHVFGGRYKHRVLTDPADLRGCIRYVHRNPVRAGCCADPGDYPWSSHFCYERVLDNAQWRPRLHVIRRVFARGSCRSENELCSDYKLFVESSDGDVELRSRRDLRYGDVLVEDLFACKAERRPRKRPDLRDIVKQVINDVDKNIDIEMVRSFKGQWYANLRAQLVRTAAAEGHRGFEIARYLHMSESRVSRIVRAMPLRDRLRRALPRLIAE
jgi:putative transposase